MELKEFVKSILKDVVDAVEETRKESSRDMRLSSKENRSVEFDIAVTVEDSGSKEGGAGIKVLQLFEAGGKVSAETKNSSVSRIQFGVYIDTQTKLEQQEQKTSYNNQNFNNSYE